MISTSVQFDSSKSIEVLNGSFQGFKRIGVGYLWHRSWNALLFGMRQVSVIASALDDDTVAYWQNMTSDLCTVVYDG